MDSEILGYLQNFLITTSEVELQQSGAEQESLTLAQLKAS